MKLVVYSTLLFICGSKQESKPRSVNLALETVLEFDNNDNSADIHIIDKVKGFLDRIKSVIGRNKVARRSQTTDDYKFTDFARNAIAILLSYDDDDFEDVLAAVDSEVRKYHYKGCKIYELLENQNVRRFMANQLDVIRDTPARKIRNGLKKVMRSLEEEKYGDKEKKVVDYINLLYLGEPKTRFKKILDNLLHYKLKTKRNDLDLAKIVRDAIRQILFDYYSNLDNRTRRDLRIKLETIWKDFNNPKENEHRVWKFRPIQTVKKDIVRANKKIANDKKIPKDKKIPEDDVSTDSCNSKPRDDIKNKNEKYRYKKMKKGRKQSLRNHPKTHNNREIIKQNREIVHDANIAIDVEKDIDRGGPKSSKRERLTFITLYPEKFTFLDTKKSSKTTKRTKIRLHKDEAHTSNKSVRKHQEVLKEVAPRHEKKEKANKRERVHLNNKKKSKSSEMDDMMEEHEKMKEILEKNREKDSMDEEVLAKTAMVKSDEIEERARETEEQELSVEKKSKSFSKTKSSNQKLRKSAKFKKTKHPETSQVDDVSSHVMKKFKKSRKFLEQDTHEGLPIESEEFDETSLRKRNVNDTFKNDTKTTLPAHFIKRIKALEDELKTVKAQIKDKPKYVEIPAYGNLDFWEGTTKHGNKTTKATKKTKATVKTTTKAKATTKTKPKTTTKTTKPEVVELVFDKTTTEKANSTYNPVFRSDNVNNASQFKVDEKPKDIEKLPEDYVDEKPKNISETLHQSDLNNEIDNYTTNIDDDINDLGANFDPLYGKNTNITNHIEHLQKYLNTTNNDPNDKTHIVRKKMLQDLTSILEEPANMTMPAEDKLSGGDILKSGDPLSMMDDADALTVK